MNRKTRFLLAGVASAIGAGLLHNWSGRGEHLHATFFSEPGYMGSFRRLTWTGGKPEAVALSKLGSPSVGSIKLERTVLRFRPAARLPNLPSCGTRSPSPRTPRTPRRVCSASSP